MPRVDSQLFTTNLSLYLLLPFCSVCLMTILCISSFAVICRAVINIGNFQLIWKIFRRAREKGNIDLVAEATHLRQLTEPEVLGARACVIKLIRNLHDVSVRSSSQFSQHPLQLMTETHKFSQVRLAPRYLTSLIFREEIKYYPRCHLGICLNYFTIWAPSNLTRNH